MPVQAMTLMAPLTFATGIHSHAVSKRKFGQEDNIASWLNTLPETIGGTTFTKITQSLVKDQALANIATFNLISIPSMRCGLCV